MMTQAASPLAISALHRVEIVERNLGDVLLVRLRQEELGEAVVADLHREAGVAVVAALQADDPSALGGVARALQGDVDRLAAARGEHREVEAVRRVLGQHLGKLRPHQRREMVVADVEMLHPLAHGGDHLRVAMAERIDAAVQMEVDQPAAVHVVEVVALAPVDHEVDALPLPFQRLAGVPVLDGLRDEIVLGLAHLAHLSDPRKRLGPCAPIDLTGRQRELTPRRRVSGWMGRGG